MNGSLWIVSYAILWIGVVSALAVSLVATRNYGRVTPEIGSSLPERVRVQLPTGLPSGSPVADLAIRALDGEILQPTQWDTTIVIQTVLVGHDGDLETFNDLTSVIPPELHARTILTSASRPELLAGVSNRVGAIHVAHDAAFEIETTLGSNIKPHVTLIQRGVVQAARPFTSLSDLAEFIDLTVRDRPAHTFHPGGSSDLRGVSS